MPSQPYVLLPAEGSEPADDWVRVGIDSHNSSRYIDAERQLRQALRVDPQHLAALNNIAVTYACAGDLLEAQLAGEKAALLSPFEDSKSLSIINANLALIYTESRKHEEALRAAELAMSCLEGLTHELQHHVVLAVSLTRAGVGKIAETIKGYETILAENPKHFPAAQNICFARTLTFDGPDKVCAQQRFYADNHRQQGFDVPHHTLSLNGRPIRVGYLSGDYKRHSAPFIFGNVVLNHTERVEPYLYCSLKVDEGTDSYTKKFKKSAGERWRSIVDKPDEEADAMIRKDKIDILVDLAGHTGGGRIPLLTRKPAPIQVTAWGFAHGSGCKEIDYFLADPIAIPEEERQYYSEKILDLPCIVTYLEPSEYSLKGTSSPPISRNGYFTYGCYCRFEKISDKYLSAVRAILLAVPDSKMIFKDEGFRRPYFVKRVLKALEGIGSKRLFFSGGTSHPDHFLSYQQCDLALDPFPHSGGTVCMEQLWMGVPILTLYGTQAAGRTCSSVLTCMGYKQWIAKSQEEYITKATDYAKYSSGILGGSRKVLRQHLLESPVVKGYVAAVENLYQRMVHDKAMELAHV